MGLGRRQPVPIGITRRNADISFDATPLEQRQKHNRISDVAGSEDDNAGAIRPDQTREVAHLEHARLGLELRLEFVEPDA